MRRATVLYRNQEGLGMRLEAGARVPDGWLRDDLWQAERAMRFRMEAEASENRQRLMTDVQGRARMRRAAAGPAKAIEGPR